MARKQVYKSRRRKCDRCKEESQKTEKVSDIIYPGGGHLCGGCIVISAYERNRERKGDRSVLDL